jgi:hypothetical protein
MKFLEMGTNGDTDPRVNWVVGERVVLRVIAIETELPNNEWSTESEHSIDENGEGHELFLIVFGVEVEHVTGVVAEIEDLEILPKVAPFARDKAHMDACFGREEG